MNHTKDVTIPDFVECDGSTRNVTIKTINSDGSPVTRGPRSICDACGTEFTPSRSDARYCTPRCRTRAYRERHSITGYGHPTENHKGRKRWQFDSAVSAELRGNDAAVMLASHTRKLHAAVEYLEHSHDTTWQFLLRSRRLESIRTALAQLKEIESIVSRWPDRF